MCDVSRKFLQKSAEDATDLDEEAFILRRDLIKRELHSTTSSWAINGLRNNLFRCYEV